MRCLFCVSAVIAALGQLACSSSNDAASAPTMPVPFANPASSFSPTPAAAEGATPDPVAPSNGSQTNTGSSANGSANDGEKLPTAVAPSAPADTSAGDGSSTPPTADGTTPPADTTTPPTPPAEPPVVVKSGLPEPGNGGIAQPAGNPTNFKVLNWAGFKAAVSYTFDDTNATQIQHYTDLNGLGVPLSFYLITNKTTEINNPVWAQALKDGHELGNHTQSHQQTGTDAALAADTDAGQQFLENKFGIKVYTMAAPYGAAPYTNIARSRYLINRGTGDAQIGPNDNTDAFNLSCFIPPMGAATSVFNGKVDAVRASGKWQVMLVHGFLNNGQAVNGEYQPVDINQFTAGVRYAKSLGDVWIDSVVTVGAYWIGQKLVSGIQPTQGAEGSTWSWTLPNHFPPGKFLRVTIDGGTLTQKGQPLAWDDHGFYEVALDAGAVTLSN